MMRWFTSVGLCCAHALLFLGSAIADDPTPVNWIDPTGGSFQDPLNWSGNSVPGTSERALFGLSSTYTVTLTDDVDLGGMSVEAGNTTFSLSGNTLALGNSTSPSLVVGPSAAGAAGLALNGGLLEGIDAALAPTPGTNGALSLFSPTTEMQLSGDLSIGGTSGSPGGTGSLALVNGAALSVGGTTSVSNTGQLLLFSATATTQAFEQFGGTVTGDGTLEILGEGSWTAGVQSGGGTTLVAPSATLTIEGAATKHLNQRTIASEGTLIIQGTGEIRGFSDGLIDVCPGGTLELQGSSAMFGSGLTNERINVDGMLRKTGAGEALVRFNVSGNGAMEVEEGSLSIAPYGSIGTVSTFSGQASVAAGAELKFGGADFDLRGAHFEGAGTVYLRNTGTILGDGTEFRSPVVLEAETNVTSGTVTYHNATWLEGVWGELAAFGTSVIAPGGRMRVMGPETKGLYFGRIANHGTVEIVGDAVVNGYGLIRNERTGIVDFQGNGSLGGTTRVSLANYGLLAKSVGLGTSLIDTVINSGVVESRSGMIRVRSTFSQSEGATHLVGGDMLIDHEMTISGGFLDVDHQGTLTVLRSYSQESAATLQMHLAGTLPGETHGVVLVTDTATLAGALALEIDAGFNPQYGDIFTILTYGSRSGAFDEITGQNLGGGLVLAHEYDLTSLWLRVQLQGDANFDGQVTMADYTMWADNFGQQGASFSQGDFNGDGKVNIADYTLWANHYGNDINQLGPLPVPEPSALMLAAMGAGGLMGLGWRRRRNN